MPEVASLPPWTVVKYWEALNVWLDVKYYEQV